MTSDNSWNKLSTVLNKVLTSKLKPSEVSSLMKVWNENKTEVSSLFSQTKETKSRASKKKDPNAPKKWRTSYLIFCADQRATLKSQFPDDTPVQITTKLGQKWQTLSQAEKDKYSKLSSKEKEEYEVEMESYVPSDDFAVETKKKRTTKAKKDPSEPKKPLPAYMLFCADERVRLAQEESPLKGKEITKELGARWRQLSDKEKEPYQKRHEVEKAEYEKLVGKTDSKSTSKSASKAKETKKKETKDVKEVKKETKKELVETKAVKKETKKEPVKETKTVKKEELPSSFVSEKIEEFASDHPSWTAKQIENQMQKDWGKLSKQEQLQYEEVVEDAEEDEALETDEEDALLDE